MTKKELLEAIEDMPMAKITLRLFLTFIIITPIGCYTCLEIGMREGARRAVRYMNEHYQITYRDSVAVDSVVVFKTR